MGPIRARGWSSGVSVRQRFHQYLNLAGRQPAADKLVDHDFRGAVRLFIVEQPGIGMVPLRLRSVTAYTTGFSIAAMRPASSSPETGLRISE
jgi:hypothetical protein